MMWLMDVSHPRVRAYPLLAQPRKHLVRVQDSAVGLLDGRPPPKVPTFQRVTPNVVLKVQLVNEGADRVIFQELPYQRLLRRWMVNVYLCSIVADHHKGPAAQVEHAHRDR